MARGSVRSDEPDNDEKPRHSGFRRNDGGLSGSGQSCRRNHARNAQIFGAGDDAPGHLRRYARFRPRAAGLVLSAAPGLSPGLARAAGQQRVAAGVAGDAHVRLVEHGAGVADCRRYRCTCFPRPRGRRWSIGWGCCCRCHTRRLPWHSCIRLFGTTVLHLSVQQYLTFRYG